jgi:hypothetical protein
MTEKEARPGTPSSFRSAEISDSSSSVILSLSKDQLPLLPEVKETAWILGG